MPDAVAKKLAKVLSCVPIKCHSMPVFLCAVGWSGISSGGGINWTTSGSLGFIWENFDTAQVSNI